MAPLVFLLHHLDHALDLVKHGLALLSDLIGRVKSGLSCDRFRIFQSKAHLLEHQGEQRDVSSDALDLHIGCGNLDSNSIEYQGKAEARTSNADD